MIKELGVPISIITLSAAILINNLWNRDQAQQLEELQQQLADHISNTCCDQHICPITDP